MEVSENKREARKESIREKERHRKEVRTKERQRKTEERERG